MGVSITQRDHPRVCGEHECWYAYCRSSPGSSPRMRGTLPRSIHIFSQKGIIPAYAGNTYWKLHELYVRRDHPRVCGEHDDMPLHCDELTGSSPRMRGTPVVSDVLFAVDSGSSPRMRGTPMIGRQSIVCAGDHPRVCGEHGMADIGDALSSGSSPRMRGTLGRGDNQRYADGIIPAYAGNTKVLSIFACHSRDHPRVCGEHKILGTTLGSKRGSSPRMRGTRIAPRRDPRHSGIIPAYAGNTSALRQ